MLQHLKFLDLRSNKISTALEEVGRVIDALSVLEVCHLRGNPFMKKEKDRLKLISLMSRMKQVECCLRTLDEVISFDERVDAWLANGGDPAQAETLRYKCAIFQRAKNDIAPEMLLELDLSNMNLSVVVLGDFSSLRKLSLQNNRIKTLAGIFIERMQDLRILDLKNNALSDLTEVVDIVNILPKILSLSISGNNFESDYRSEFICSCDHFA